MSPQMLNQFWSIWVGGRKPTLKKLRWSINVNLKVSKEEYLVVDYMDFDEFVTEVYGLKDRYG
jgi:hypothetical protein